MSVRKFFGDHVGMFPDEVATPHMEEPAELSGEDEAINDAQDAIARSLRVADANRLASESGVLDPTHAYEAGANARERAGRHMAAVVRELESDDSMGPDDQAA